MPDGQPQLVAAIGAINSVNKVYATPTTFTPGTTRVFHNGVLLDPDGGPNLDGWTESLNQQELTMNFAPETGDTMFIYYEDTTGTGGVVSGGMTGGIPTIISALVIAPALEYALVIAPEILITEGESNLLPELIKVIELKPEMKQAINLKPEIIKVEVE